MHPSTSQKKAGMSMADSQIARTAALYRQPQPSKIAHEPKSVAEVSNKLDTRFRVYTEGLTTNQKVYKGTYQHSPF